MLSGRAFLCDLNVSQIKLHILKADEKKNLTNYNCTLRMFLVIVHREELIFSSVYVGECYTTVPPAALLTNVLQIPIFVYNSKKIIRQLFHGHPKALKAFCALHLQQHKYSLLVLQLFLVFERMGATRNRQACSPSFVIRLSASMAHSIYAIII